MPIEKTIIGLIMMKAKHVAGKYDKATMDPAQSQIDKLLSILQKNKDTEYGRRYGFSEIRSVTDYQRQVPIITYEDIRDYIERVAAGAVNVLTAEPPLMFARTSGTMGSPKYIIVTPTCRSKEHGSVMSIWGYHLLTAYPNLRKGVNVTLVSTAVEGYTSAGIPYGSTSGCIYKNMPAIFRKRYAIPYRVFEITDYQAKYYTVMRIAMEQDAAVISTANPSSILKMCEKGNEFGEEIIRDIRDGSLTHKFPIADDIRDSIEKYLHPNRKRSEFLSNLKSKRSGLLIPADYWPNLTLITCWKGGTVGHYIEKFPQWFNPDGDRNIPIRDWGYLSSEARCSIPLSDDGSAGALAILTNFYEFVDIAQQQANPDRPDKWDYLTADQLKDGGEYYIFITTMGGLYRYDINDIVRVEGYYNNTPKITFVRKGRDMTNMTGEKLSANQVIDATNRAAAETGVTALHFRAEADLDESRYIINVEFAGDIPQDKGRTFLVSFDENLKRINIEYKGKRDSMRLAAPVLFVMRTGWFERCQKTMNKNGSRTFQAKEKVLCPERTPLAEIEPELNQAIEMTQVEL
ncbi:MAG: GH3 auxin-responsive promoter family protein [Planctomycetes bacterium]|nr:GH3 auxin-responsive promoter family protein [Planctomycetota bacterium]